MTRPRACAAVINNDRILMVYHKSLARCYWTLPGGGVDKDETPEQAAVREVKEETGLDVIIDKFLFTEDYEFGVSYCYLADLSGDESPSLGCDPEEGDLSREKHLLQDVAWLELKDKKDDMQVSKVISILGIEL